MSAEVVAYSAHPEDTSLTIMVECRDCEIQFGWCADTPSGNDRLNELADRHNVQVHHHRRVPTP